MLAGEVMSGVKRSLPARWTVSMFCLTPKVNQVLTGFAFLLRQDARGRWTGIGL